MLKILDNGKYIEIVSTDEGYYIVKGEKDYRIVGLKAFEWVRVEKFEENLSVIPFWKSKLKEGQHKSPPKGYPKERSKYAVPQFYMFPIDTKKHVRAAIAYFDKHKWRPEEHKEEAARRILRAAKKFGIEVSENSGVYRAAKKKKNAVSDVDWPESTDDDMMEFSPEFVVNPL